MLVFTYNAPPPIHADQSKSKGNFCTIPLLLLMKNKCICCFFQHSLIPPPPVQQCISGIFQQSSSSLPRNIFKKKEFFPKPWSCIWTIFLFGHPTCTNFMVHQVTMYRGSCRYRANAQNWSVNRICRSPLIKASNLWTCSFLHDVYGWADCLLSVTFVLPALKCSTPHPPTLIHLFINSGCSILCQHTVIDFCRLDSLCLQKVHYSTFFLNSTNGCSLTLSDGILYGNSYCKY